jgi:hypothetical protein
MAILYAMQSTSNWRDLGGVGLWNLSDALV